MSTESLDVLHICSAYSRTILYRNLVDELSNQISGQVVYVPVRNREEIGINGQHLAPNIAVIFEHLLKKTDRIFYRRKIRKIFDSLEDAVELGNFDCVHAHFLYSDGGVAYEIFKSYGIPYFVTVRNTDINYFRRYRPDLNGRCEQILRSAQGVIFLTPSYRDRFLRDLKPVLETVVSAKSVVIPNAIDEMWFVEDGEMQSVKPDDELKILSVGDFSSNKNLERLAKAAGLVARRKKVSLTLVGAPSGDIEKYTRKLARLSGQCPLVIIPRVEKQLLKSIYREHDVFAMPSIHESFGLVYIEALSQGRPVIHSRGEGIDGLIDQRGVSVAVNPRSTREIATALELLSVEQNPQKCVQASHSFRWEPVAQKLACLYRTVNS